MNEAVRLRGRETLPARAYYEKDYWEAERAEIWSKSWIMATPTGDLLRPGDFVSVSVAGYPLLIIRSEDGIRAYHNVCRHRASPLVLEKSGHTDRLLCPYHGWRYSFDGELLNAPSVTCNKAEFGLFPVACEVWGELVFVRLSVEGPAFSEWIADLSAASRLYSLDNMKLVRKLSIEADINWKTYADNYAEGWHVPTIHPGLNSALDMASYRVEALGDVLQKHSAAKREGGSTDGLWLWRLPGLFINMYSWGVNVEQLEPCGPQKMRLHYHYFFKDQQLQTEAEREEIIAWSLQIAREDIAICKRVQENLQAGIYTKGVLSPIFENGVTQVQEFVRAAHKRAGLQDCE